MCFVCGLKNRFGLKAQFYKTENDEIAAIFKGEEEHQGYPGRLHGGIASALLDEAIGRAINVTDPDAWGVTVELNVKFRKPVPIDREVHSVARITRDTRKLFEGTGEIVLEDGTVAVEARGTYLRLPVDKIAEGEFASDEWRPDEREAPTDIDW